MNNFPCNKTLKQFINCCQVMDCIDIKSSDNSISIEKSDCGVDLTMTGNNLDNILEINDAECLTFMKEFIDGKLIITPQMDWDCVADNICGLCTPPVCPAPIALSIEIVGAIQLFLINGSDDLLINSTDSFIL